jgi:hypothetical protein
MRRRKLKWLWVRLKQIATMDLSREELLMKLGAPRQNQSSIAFNRDRVSAFRGGRTARRNGTPRKSLRTRRIKVGKDWEVTGPRDQTMLQCLVRAVLSTQ